MVEQQYQTFRRRAGAYLLDRLPFYGLQQISGLFSRYFASFYFGLAWGQLWGWAWIAYRVLAHGLWGQTLGKKICKVKVVDLSGQRLSMRQAFLREIVPIVLDLASLVYVILNLDAYERILMGGEPNVRLATAGTVYFVVVTIWWVAQIATMRLNDKRRAIHDYIAGSVVLRLNVQVAEPGERHEGVAGSWLKGLERLGRPGMAAIVTVLAAIAVLAVPTLFVIDGELCPGYRVDLSGYYLKLIPVTLIAAGVGTKLGKLIGEGESGCFLWGSVAFLAVLAVINMFIAIWPGC